MLAIIIKRLLTSLLIVWGVISICFLILHLVPGDPASLYIRPEIPAEVVANIRAQMGLDLPIWKQYFVWIREFSTGNFGLSFTHQKTISAIFAETIPNTLRLTVIVLIFQYFVGILLGVISALRHKTLTDRIINGSMLFLYSMPGFWLAIIAIFVFSLKLGWLPSSQMQSLHEINGFWPILWDRTRHLILPVLVLSIPFITYTARFVRENLVNILAKPYILAAYTYGLSHYKIIYRYALRNALLPLVTLLGLYLPFLLGGAVITEFIFAWPGMGRITVNAIFTHDYALILASTFIAALAVVLGNLISDLLYFIVDPRIRTGKSLK